MSKFSPSEAALEGFRLTREHPRTIFGWGVLYSICIFLIGRLMLLSVDPNLIALTRKGTPSEDDIEQVSNLLVQSWPAFILVLLLVTGLLSILMCGIYRIVLRPHEKGFLHLRLGADELRLTGVNFLLIMVGMVFLTAELVMVGLAKENGGPLAFFAAVGLLALTLWIGVRLSLATPMTFALRKVAIRDAWRISKRHFWQLFGVILLAAIFYVMVWLLFSIIGVALIEISGPDALKNISSLRGPAILSVALYVFLQLILQVIQIVMLYAPFGVAYQQLRNDF